MGSILAPKTTTYWAANIYGSGVSRTSFVTSSRDTCRPSGTWSGKTRNIEKVGFTFYDYIDIMIVYKKFCEQVMIILIKSVKMQLIDEKTSTCTANINA